MQLAAAGVLFWALVAFVAEHDVAGGVIKLILGVFFCMWAGGRRREPMD